MGVILGLELVLELSWRAVDVLTLRLKNSISFVHHTE